MAKKPTTPERALLESALGRGTIKVTFDVTPEQFFQLLQGMNGPIKIKGKTRAMLDLEEVLKIIPVSKSTLLRMLGEGRFPPGHFISPNRRVWYEDEILKWQDTLVANVSTRKRSVKKAKAVVKKKKAKRRS